MRKSSKIVILFGLAVAVAAAGAGWKWKGAGQIASARTEAARPEAAPRGAPVETMVARASKSAPTIQAVGSLQSDESVRIAPELAGRIAEILFKEGEEVKAGDLLVKLDDALVRGEVAEREATFALAKANLARANTLAKTGNVTERARDEATAQFESGRAALELANIRVDKHALRAPFNGVVGLRLASVGAYVSVGSPIVNLEKIDTLKVDFKIPEIHLGDVSVGQIISVTIDALPGRTFEGTIYAIDPMVDVNGRALQIRARLANADKVLRPGLFARIVITGKREQTVLLVPESAIVPRGRDSIVYRVENGKALESRVKLGQRRAGQVEIVDGLAPETTVVTSGQQRLRDGAVVNVVSSDSQARG